MRFSFLGLPDHPNARVALIPVPYEQSTTWLKGTAQAPIEILKVSPYLEFFDEETKLSPHKELGFVTYPVEEYPLDIEKALLEVEKKTDLAITSGYLPILLGGEHTITLGAIRAFKKHCPTLKVLHLDAHLDFRKEYLGSNLNHATVMRHVYDQGHSILSVGIRALSEEEYEEAKREGLEIVFAQDLHTDFKKALQRIKSFVKEGFVYVSMDVDVMDPSIAPGVGTPEPGGINWTQLLEILKVVAKARIVGMDIVETKPLPHYPFTEFLVGKIILKFSAYLAQTLKNEFKE